VIETVNKKALFTDGNQTIALFRLNENMEYHHEEKVRDSMTKLSPASSIYLATLFSRPTQTDSRESDNRTVFHPAPRHSCA